MGRGEQVKLIDYVRIFEKTLGREAKLEMLPLQDGDLKDTSANIESIKQDIGYSPKVSVEEGIPRFLEWYCDYFKVK
jgi:UDP-glucuronate 4-epimerase